MAYDIGLETGLSNERIAASIVSANSRKFIITEKLTAFGNSITESAFNFAQWFSSETNGSVIFFDNKGFGGDTTQDMLDRIDTIKPQTTLCTIMEAVNDSANGVTPLDHAVNVKEIIQTLANRGFRVVFLASPPSDSTERAADIEKMNLYDFNTCVSLGVEYYAIWDQFTDASTSGWKAGSSIDGTHPIAEVQRIAGESLAGMFGRYPSVPLSRSNNNASGLMPNSCFLTDSNSDGTPDGYTSYGGGTRMLTASEVGNKFTLSDVGVSPVYVADQTARVSVVAGKEYLVSCKISAEVNLPDSSINVELRTPSGTKYLVREASATIDERIYTYSVNPTIDGEVGVALRILGSNHDCSVSVSNLDVFCLSDYTTS